MAEYFSHDYDARTDERIIDLMLSLDWKGYGLYWGIVELLYQNDGVMQLNYKRIAYSLHADEKDIETIIQDFDLFVLNGQNFWSESVNKRLELRDKKSKTASESAKSRWRNSKSNKEARHDLPQVYVVNCFSETESFLKIGITQDYISRRFSGKLPYEYEVIAQFFSTKFIKIEQALNELCAEFSMIPQVSFHGDKECYLLDAYEVISKYNASHIENRYIANASALRRNAKKESKVKESIESKEKKESKNNARAFYSEQFLIAKGKEKYDAYCRFAGTIFNEKYTNAINEPVQHIISIPKQVSYEQFENLAAEAKKRQVKIMDLLDVMINKPTYLKGTKSLYLTLLNWVKREPIKGTNF